MNKKYIPLLLVGLLVLAVPLTVFISQQVQNLTQQAAAGDETTANPLTLTATFKSISIYSPFTNDNNTNNKALVEWRRSGESTWKRAHDLYIDRADKQGRGSIVGLTHNTAYEVRVTYQDPDGGGTVTGQVTTRNEVIPLGTGLSLYVATNGNDTNPGTETQPFRTVQKALNSVQAGGTIYIKSGTYSETLTLRTSGTAQNYITLTKYQNDTVILDGNNGAIGDILTLNGADYIRIAGLEFRNAGASLIKLVEEDGNQTNGGSDYVVIENNRLIEPAYGLTIGEITVGTVHLRNDSSYGVIRNNTMHRNTPMTTKMGIPAVMNWVAGKGLIVYNNTISGGFEDSVRLAREDVIAESRSQDVDIYDNRIDGACFDDAIQPEGVGMNVRVWNNIISRCFVTMAFAPTIKGPVYVFRNTVYDSDHPTRGTSALYKLGDEDEGRRGRKYFYHNTFYANAPVTGVTGYKQTNTGIGNIISRNNIIHASRYVIEAGCDAQCSYDYDAMFTTDPNRFIESGGRFGSLSAFCSGRGFECNGIEIDTSNEFVNTAGKDFRLKTGSALINKGELLYGFNDANSSWPMADGAPDIGAYESGSIGPTPTGPTATQGPTVSLTGTVFIDDGDGVKESGEPGVSQATVTVSGTTFASTTTNSSGQYSFPTLQGGTYTVTLANISGYEIQSQNPVTKNLTTNGTQDFAVTQLPTVTPTRTPTPTPTPATGTSIELIESGGTAAFTDSQGRVWDADKNVTGGSITDRGAITIANTTDDRIYQTERWGASTYAIPVPNGTYTVKLHFAETFSNITASGQRVFHVSAENQQVLPNFDIFKEAGARNTALIKQFSIPVSDGSLSLVFTAQTNQPIINGIEILQSGTTPPTATPTRAPTLSPTQPVSGGTSLSLTLKLHGLGTGGDVVNPTSTGNMTPQRTTRPVTVEMYSALNNTLVGTATGNVTYNSSTGVFTGTIQTPSGVTTTGYNLRVTSPGYLVTQQLGVFVNENQTNTVPTVSLTTGDINNDKSLDILDYNLLVSCYGSIGTIKPGTCVGNGHIDSDLFDDGNVNFIDLNLWLREFSKKS